MIKNELILKFSFYNYVQNNSINYLDPFGYHYLPIVHFNQCMPHRHLPESSVIQDYSCDCFGNCAPKR